ncbi:MAG: hypothetical protein ACOYMM_09565 [Phycisphaerales bacterium]
MSRFTSRFTSLRAPLLAGGALIAFTSTHFIAVSSAHAQTANSPAVAKSAPTAKPAAVQATVNAGGAVVRCAANTESGYPFGTLAAGQVVTIVETQPGWVRVRTEGDAFAGWGGFVPALPGVTLSADGKSLKVTGTAPINAPNDTADFNPDRSWKAIGYLTTGDELPVINVLKGERDTFYAVPLGSKTSGWIAESAITRVDATAAKPAPAPKITPGTDEGIPAGQPTTTETPAGTTVEKTEGADGTVTETEKENISTSTSTSTSPTTTTDGKPAAKTPEAAAPKKREPAKASDSPAVQAARASRAKFDGLEATWRVIAKETASNEDLFELKGGYAEVAADSTMLPSVRRNANTRITQIENLVKLREIKTAAENIKQDDDTRKEQLANLEDWLRARQSYDAVGILNASLVYDGERLPRLYRLQDPVSGFTTAYLMEDPEFKLSSMLGLVVGVKGPRHFDESLRRDIITAKTGAILQTGTETKISSPTRTAPASDATEESGK